MSKRKSRRVERAPKFALARMVLGTASVTFAILAIGGWFLAFHTVSIYLAAFLSILSFVSALVVPTCAEAFERAQGWNKFLMGVVILTFACFDWYGVHQGFITIEKLALGAQHTAAVNEWTAGRDALSTQLEAAQGKLDGLPTAQAACEGHGPQNCAARLAGLQADREALTGLRDAAQARMDAYGKAPEMDVIFPHELVGLFAGAIQFVLFIGFSTMASITRKEDARLKAERNTPKPKAKPARKSRPIRQPVRGHRPYLIVDNG